MDHSYEAEKILFHNPSWQIRWGLTFIFVTIIAVIIVGFFIKLPEITEAEVLITDNGYSTNEEKWCNDTSKKITCIVFLKDSHVNLEIKQRINVQFNNDSGTVSVLIGEIAYLQKNEVDTNNQAQYIIEILLKDGYKKMNGESISLENGMYGTAKILVDGNSLMAYILSSLIKTIERVKPDSKNYYVQ